MMSYLFSIIQKILMIFEYKINQFVLLIYECLDPFFYYDVDIISNLHQIYESIKI